VLGRDHAGRRKFLATLPPINRFWRQRLITLALSAAPRAATSVALKQKAFTASIPADWSSPIRYPSIRPWLAVDRDHLKRFSGARRRGRSQHARSSRRCPMQQVSQARAHRAWLGFGKLNEIGYVEGRENANSDAGLGFIWRISD